MLFARLHMVLRNCLKIIGESQDFFSKNKKAEASCLCRLGFSSPHECINVARGMRQGVSIRNRVLVSRALSLSK